MFISVLFFTKLIQFLFYTKDFWKSVQTFNNATSSYIIGGSYAGFFIGIFASSGVLLSLSRLHFEQQVTKFVHSFEPPLDLGITWSKVKFFFDPQ
jgi:hypothetical protein